MMFKSCFDQCPNGNPIRYVFQTGHDQYLPVVCIKSNSTITDCAQQGEDIMYITVQDLQPPAPVCNAQLAIPLNNEGEAIIPAYIFNAGSYDNCGDVYFKVKRMAAPVGYTCSNEGNPNNLFDDFIQFCCEDIEHNNIMVVLRVYDVRPVMVQCG
jgi:hypothetical protein